MLSIRDENIKKHELRIGSLKKKNLERISIFNEENNNLEQQRHNLVLINDENIKNYEFIIESLKKKNIEEILKINEKIHKYE